MGKNIDFPKTDEYVEGFSNDFNYVNNLPLKPNFT